MLWRIPGLGFVWGLGQGVRPATCAEALNYSEAYAESYAIECALHAHSHMDWYMPDHASGAAQRGLGVTDSELRVTG